MKRILPILAIATVTMILLSACSRNAGADTKVTYADTVGLAQFREAKIKEQAQQVVYVPVKRTTTPRSTNNSSDYGSGSMNTASQNNAKTAEKKGWSKGAKGAAIGGGGGAVLGAVINKKNRVAGGVIGGVVGAGVGYLIGRSKDKKDGRY
ncbi:MAG: YMGG-like glycine zipper-containing protein [Chitinophagaceae bacterium]